MPTAARPALARLGRGSRSTTRTAKRRQTMAAAFGQATEAPAAPDLKPARLQGACLAWIAHQCRAALGKCWAPQCGRVRLHPPLPLHSATRRLAAPATNGDGRPATLLVLMPGALLTPADYDALLEAIQVRAGPGEERAGRPCRARCL